MRNLAKQNLSPFHFAFKVKDLESTRRFYIGLLECSEGRSTETWIDFDFFGNQLSAHVSQNIPQLDYCGSVDGISVPIPHFGCIISSEEFDRIQHRFEEHSLKFIIPLMIRYAGKKGEQRTMFVLDESGNPIELKSFKNESEIFLG